ncbi:cytochrome P450 [Coprinopsis cinerea okayama7|uniref:Cytochrome P450 n=1 Tax=Coprinopsis cinerea (strain Okayama-7 / 130 / ATCC MYA-4618 / FGSC 9003) TaxID=240176 RepID=A8NIC4_COPC7|nr:cytochrome P450 [Coprinopsis cinerea okayama7\|eukprot:XP_001833966.1 cytochrome P450 [Coprinopsis cinerea okayama7\
MAYSATQILVAGGAVWFVYQWYLFRVTKKKVDSIPTFGGDGFISSYLSGWKFLFQGHRIINEGSKKYPGRAFKVPTITTPNRWLIIVSGPELAGDVRKAGENQLNFNDYAFEGLQSKYTFGDCNTCAEEPYHVKTAREFIRAFPSRFGGVNEEVVECVAAYLPKRSEWTLCPLGKILTPIVARASNRLLVGLPLCQNEDYCALLAGLTTRTFIVANILNMLPESLKPLVGRLLSRFPTDVKKLNAYLGPLFEERRRLDKAYGSNKWEGRPNDFISALLDTVPEKFNDTKDLALRVINLNIAAIHTTVITLSFILLELAARQEYIAPIREEIESVAQEYGWTKESMSRMVKLDSFMKEVARLCVASARRKARTDYQLSDGTVIPKGFSMATAGATFHLDPEAYEHPEEFDGFRFCKDLQDSDGANLGNLRNQMVALDPNFLLFGQGRPACPGRIFAVNEIKLIVAHILVNYDIKLPNDSTSAPPPIWFAALRAPSPNAAVLFRKRQTE